MSAPSTSSAQQPRCVISLLEHLSNAAAAFEAGKPLGPYLLDSLLEDVDLCPALQQPAQSQAYAQLHEAVGKARSSARVAVACPSAEREWAAQELRSAVAHAQQCLEEWQKAVLAASDDASGDPIGRELERIGGARCPACAFAEPVSSS